MTIPAARALRWLVTAVIVVLLATFARGVDWAAAWAAVRQAELPPLLAAVAINLLSLVLKGVRWWVFLRPMGAPSLGLALRATFAGAGLNNVLVAQGGEAARVLLVSRAAHVSSESVLAALAVERLLDAVTYLALLIGAAFLLDLPEPIARWRGAASLALMGALLALAVLVGSTRASAGADARPRVPATLVGRTRAWTLRFVADLRLVASPARLAAALLLSLGAWAMQVATYHLTARAAHLPISLAGSVATLLAVGIGFLIRATPGNVGIFQVVYAVTAASFGVARAPAVAAALLIQTLQVVPTTAIGMLFAPRLVLEGRSLAGRGSGR